ncbi:MAG: magnesium transporter [Candidatus Thermoplasmatota archaeon]|nr:magnesium transporter [Candidatus Thermoplasmatota archaeon]
MAWKVSPRIHLRGRHPARGLLRKVRPYLHLDRTLLRQSGIVLFLCAIFTIFPGLFLGSLERLLFLVPGLIVLIPPTVGLRGNIFGALASRMGSKLHLGVLNTRIRGNRTLNEHLLASLVQLMLLSILIPVLGMLIPRSLGIQTAPLSTLLFISVMGGIVSGIFMFAISVGVTFFSFNLNWDPDNVSTPIIATSGDLMTIPIMFLFAWVSLSIPSSILVPLTLSMILIFVIVTVVVLLKRSHEVMAVLRSAIPFEVGAVIISTFAGIVIALGLEPVFAGSIFLIFIPVFNGQGGSMGSVMGSRLTSAAYLGSIKLTKGPNLFAVSTAITMWMIAMVVFSFMSIAAMFLSPIAGISPPPFIQVLLVMALGGTVITLISSAAAYYIAYFSMKFGLDPDNVVIPLLTASMDIIGSGSLLASIMLMGLIFG